MRVIGREKLDAFCGKHTDARKWIENWLADVELAVWSTPQDIKSRYASTSFLANNIVILNVKGNEYRMELTIAYKTGVVIVQWIGTHSAYESRNKAR